MLMNSKTGVAFSIIAIAAVIVLFASGPIVGNQQALASREAALWAVQPSHFTVGKC